MVCISNDHLFISISLYFQTHQFAEVFQRKDHDQDNLIKIEMADVSSA